MHQYSNMHYFYYYFDVSKCIVSNILLYVSKIKRMFPNAFSCFQYPIFVSNIQYMFPNENDVSKRQCFQCMFPIYIEPMWRFEQFLVFQSHKGKILGRHDEFPHGPCDNSDDTQAWISQTQVQYDNLVVPKSPIDNPNSVGIAVSAYGSQEWIFRLEIRWEPPDIPKLSFDRIQKTNYRPS